jgi:hypothetical protein
MALLSAIGGFVARSGDAAKPASGRRALSQNGPGVFLRGTFVL